MLVRTELSAGFLHCNACAVRCYGPQTRSNSRGYLLSLRPCPSKISLQHVCRVGGEKTSKASDNRAVSGQDKAGIPYAKQAFLGLWMASGVGVYTLLSSDAVILPKLPPQLWQLGLGAACTSLLTPLLLKVLLGDRFQVELHRGKVYFQLLEVPPTGPPIPAGSVQVRPTGDVRGNGAFAVVPIMKGQRICNYEGELIDVADYWERYPSGASDYVMRIDDEYALDARDLAPRTAQFSAVHMNHSRRPNVGRFYARSEKRVSFYALRDISVGEEITIDYGRDFWMGREDQEV
uniref:SET domain-containing protein n=1 Tax=Dunaliella tertiolecta TaxID=3047 RepID=A0A7S3R388_DUNTE|mmetsp:Transcript_15713/g.41415  ORF Transcript_15713/g.41415 Transcript_15713/m.41415 type:complete len:291 (+) Transcript_15713:61-933(+)